MVKNNGTPFEVKKPFETVYELKNEYETLSLEEFMKTYEADEKVIDSYKDEVEYVNVWAPKGSGPTIDGANVNKWCSNCAKNVSVTYESTKYCPDCGHAFGTIAKGSDINKQIDTNRKQVAERGGTYEYWEEEGSKPDGTDYKRRGTSYTGSKK